jgi:hypothetical protein
MKNFKRCLSVCLIYLIIMGSWGCTTPPGSQTIPPPTLDPTVLQPTAQISTPINTATNQSTEIPTQDVVWEILGKVDKDRALDDLRRITGETPICDGSECFIVSSRPTGSEGLQWVKAYVSTELGQWGYSVALKDWSNAEYSDQNLIARKEGTTLPDEVIYFVAHLDGVGNGQVEKYPGADDDASGVADLLEVARVISGYSFERSVVFMFSTGEEQGALGVKSYLRQISSEEMNTIKYVVDIDVIGYDQDRDGVMQLFHGDHAPSKALAETMCEIMLEYEVNLVPEITKGCG